MNRAMPTIILLPILSSAFAYAASFSTHGTPEIPLILSTSVSPTKVRPGDTMLITAEIKDSAGIASAIADMAGIETLQHLINGNVKKYE